MIAPLRSLMRAQKDQIVKTLVNGLEAQLLLDATAEGLETIAAAPEAVDYWIIQAPQLKEILNHREAAVTISHTEATTYDIRLSGDAAGASMIATSYIAISLVFKRPGGYPALLRRGRTLVEAEIVELLADVYRGAILEVLLRDAVDGQTILEVMPVSDFADTIVEDDFDGALGRAILEFEITGQGAHPKPQYP